MLHYIHMHTYLIVCKLLLIPIHFKLLFFVYLKNWGQEEVTYECAIKCRQVLNQNF